MNNAQQLFAKEFYFDADLRLVQAVPPTALNILDLDCRTGRLGELLKNEKPERVVTGLCRASSDCAIAATRLGYVLCGDFKNAQFPWEPGSFDCIIVPQSLTHCTNPQALLESLHALLVDDGRLLVCFPNMGHWLMINRLLSGDCQHRLKGLFDQDAQHFFGSLNMFKLLLDAGYLPQLYHSRILAAPDGWLQNMALSIAALGIAATNFARRSQTYQSFFCARPIKMPAAHYFNRPVSVGVCVNDEAVLDSNLLASPCLQSGIHEIFTINGAPSAADGLNAAIQGAQHELVVLAHQDVYLPAWWIAKLWQQYEKARELTGDKVGVMGVFGCIERSKEGARHIGCVLDSEVLLDIDTALLPRLINNLDELVLILPRSSPLRFEPALGFHLYGTDICLSAYQHGLNALVIEAPCLHNARLLSSLPSAYHDSARILSKKWPTHLPIASVCALIESGGQLRGLNWEQI